ncbi:MAG: DUF3277 family protein [Salinibacterium sp.]|nr:MAG: DUF3277 family protein [Salinibacterium sp.]
MAGRATTHSLRSLTFSYGGYSVDSGRADEGDVVTIEQENDDYGYVGGPDGEGIFFEQAAGVTTVTLRLMKSALANSVFSAMQAVARALGGAPAPLMISNARGTGKMISIAAVIAKLPDEQWAQQPGPVEWRFLVHDPDRIVNSN